LFNDRVLRKMFGPKREEVTGDCRKMRNKELSDLYSSPNVIRMIKSRRMRCVGHVTPIGERRGAYSVSAGRLKEKRPLGRPRCRWEDKTRMVLQE
jgi:hypothetical protein